MRAWGAAWVLGCCLLLVAIAPSGGEWTPGSPGVCANDQLLYKLFFKEPNSHIQLLGNVSDTPGSLTRTFLSSGHRQAAALLQRWMSEAGMTAWVDSIGNVHGRVEARDAHAPTMFIGSHYDTVVDGGKYDGALGIVAGITAVKALLLDVALRQGVITPGQLEAAQTADIDVRDLLGQKRFSLLSSPVEVVAFSDEEGVRFQSTYLGSRALTGTLLDSGLLQNRDAAGLTVTDALEALGFAASETSLRKIRVPAEKIKGYVEVHMEQGPVLEALGQALGPVTAIAGQTRLQANIVGEQGHAGTVPMAIRHDPLAATAEIIAELERICNGGHHAGGPTNPEVAEDTSLVCTVGSISVWPNAGNVIAGSATFTMDIRSRWDANRAAVITRVRRFLAEVCARRGLTCGIEVKNEADAVQCHPDVVQGLVKATEDSAHIIGSVLRQQAQYKERLPQAVATMQGACAAVPDGASMAACQGVLMAAQQNASARSVCGGRWRQRHPPARAGQRRRPRRHGHGAGHQDGYAVRALPRRHLPLPAGARRRGRHLRLRSGALHVPAGTAGGRGRPGGGRRG